MSVYDNWLLSGAGGPMDDDYPEHDPELECPECGESFEYDEDKIGTPCPICKKEWPEEVPGILEEK